MSEIKIFNLRIDVSDYITLSGIIRSTILDKKKISITYINANSIVLVQENSELKIALDKSSVVYSDGIGIYFASKLLTGRNDVKRFNWTDHALQFLQLCEKEGWKIFFIGSTEKVIKKAINVIQKYYPGIAITGFLDGFGDVSSNYVINKINESNAEIVWVGMGSPKQEIWIEKNKYHINSNIIHSVGDVFSFLAGERQRGPKIIQDIGFEWLVRLINHPFKYFRRYVYGIPQFIFLVVREKYFRKIHW